MSKSTEDQMEGKWPPIQKDRFVFEGEDNINTNRTNNRSESVQSSTHFVLLEIYNERAKRCEIIIRISLL